MNGVVFIETTTGSPVHHVMWRAGFGLADLDTREGCDARMHAMNLSGLMSAFKMKTNDLMATGNATVRCVSGGGSVMVIREAPENNLLTVTIFEESIPEETMEDIATGLTGVFIQNHADAIQKTASGIVRSLKKLMRPVIADVVWSAIEKLNSSLAKAICMIGTCDWVLSSRCPELLAAARKPPSAVTLSKADVEENMKELLGTNILTVLATELKREESLHIAAVHRLLLTLSRIHYSSSPSSITYLSHTLSATQTLYCFCYEDMFAIFPLATPTIHSSFIRTHIHPYLPPLNAFLRFAHDNNIKKKSSAPASPR
eukprot:TRINITY_DN864_c5_g1_i1.p1 TRINITY_DN864_c5_g1~~TRINITY_DN864_c5_g1_i1.p1  ORF type:complete len:315 (+),score=50.54 TRINITY_DN864_c5_g1_i1:37-981(+)